MPIDVLGLRWQAGEPIVDLARQARLTWNKLHWLLTSSGFDRSVVRERQELLSDACRMATSLGYGDYRRACRTVDDPDALRGLDDVACRMQERYPHLLGQDQIDAQYKLFDMLISGA